MLFNTNPVLFKDLPKGACFCLSLKGEVFIKVAYREPLPVNNVNLTSGILSFISEYTQVYKVQIL